MAKSQAKKQLTWYPIRSCWVKKYRKTRHYIPVKCSGKSDESGYFRSLAYWQWFKGVLDGTIPRDTPFTDLVSDDVFTADSPTKPVNRSLTANMATNYGSVVISQNGSETLPTAIRPLVDLYLAEMRECVQMGDFGTKNYGEIVSSLNDFAAPEPDTRQVKFRTPGFCKSAKKSEIAEITADVLADYRKKQIELINAEKIGPHLARKRIQQIRRLMVWLADKGAIDVSVVPQPEYARLPKKHKLSPKSKIETLSVEDVQRLFIAANQRERCLLALALNAGYTQIDQSTLEHSMIKRGRDDGHVVIERDRNKTDILQHTRLWKITEYLLDQTMTDEKESSLVFLTSRGNPLVHSEIREDGNIRCSDSVKNMFDRLKKKAAITSSVGWKGLRKLGADRLSKHFSGNPVLVDHYLAHSDKGMRKHYANRYLQELWEAVDYLDREVFQLSSCM
jgi:integrase